MAQHRVRALNILRSNRRLVWVASAGAVLLLITPLFFVPSLLRGRVTAALETRTGLATRVSAISLDGGGARVQGLHLESRNGAGVQIDVAHVDAEFGWFALLLRGTGAVTGVRATGITAKVDIASPGFAALREKLGTKTSDDGARGPSKGQRHVEATRFSLQVRDGANEVLALEGVTAELSPKLIKSSLSRLRASKPGLAAATMTGVDVTLERGTEWRLSRVHVDDAHVAIETPVLPASGAGTDADAAQAKADEARDAREDNHNADDADAPDESAGQAPPKAAVAAESGSRRKSLQSLLTKLAPDAVLDLTRARIEQVSGQKNIPILNDVACELMLEPGGAMRVTGKGAAPEGGRLHMDMRFWPDDLRADGRVSLSALPLTLFVPILPSVPWYEPQKSRIYAELTIKAESPARVSLDGYADLRDVSLSAARLATTPVQGIHFGIAGRGHWFPADRRLEVETGSVGLGKAKADVKGAVELTSDHYAFDLNAALRPTPCTDAVRSIPSALLGDMALAEWRGVIAGKLRFQTDSRDLDKTVLSIDITDRCGFEVVPVLADLSRFARPFIHSVTEPDGSFFEMETGPGTENWTPIDAMSPYLVHAIMVHEDPQFFSHHGFSPINIRNALVRDLRERRYAVGASTISMQLVKNVFLHREKTLARKIQEVLLTWWTERVMEKRDILELYLNVIEYGPGVYGIRNAAQHYWRREPSELSPAESSFLANILPNPKRYHSYYERNALSPSMASTVRRFVQRLGDRGVYDKEATDYGVQEVEHFRFARDGKTPEPRTIAGSAAPLPYQNDAVTGETVVPTRTTNTATNVPRGFE